MSALSLKVNIAGLQTRPERRLAAVESTVRYLDIEVDDALAIAEQADVRC